MVSVNRRFFEYFTFFLLYFKGKATMRILRFNDSNLISFQFQRFCNAAFRHHPFPTKWNYNPKKIRKCRKYHTFLPIINIKLKSLEKFTKVIHILAHSFSFNLETSEERNSLKHKMIWASHFLRLPLTVKWRLCVVVANKCAVDHVMYLCYHLLCQRSNITT